MPTETLVVGGKKYIYFAYYSSASKSKKRIYCGPSWDESSKRTAQELQHRYDEVKRELVRLRAEVNLHLEELISHRLAGDRIGAEKEWSSIGEVLGKRLSQKERVQRK